MDTDHRVRLAHHLISTSIFKKLLCPFSGSLELYQTEQAPSSVFHKFFGVRFAGRGSIPSTPSRRVPDLSCYRFRPPTSTPRTTINPRGFSGRTTYYQHLEEKFRRTAKN